MTETAKPFCPLYREASESWKKSASTASAHAGLLFDKFGDAWTYKTDRNGHRSVPPELEFDKGVGRNKTGANDWINSFWRSVGSEEQLAEACARQRALVEKLGGKVLCLTNTDRFVTGMGREHPLENGFAWHHTLGVPYLPGSSLKGMLRAWLREERGDIEKDRRGNDVWAEPDDVKENFGTQGGVGQVILLDMLPTNPPQLDVDVMTPHYGPYYQDREGKTPPGDWHSPVPISFLTVGAGQSWQFGIVPAARVRSIDETTLESLAEGLLAAFEVCGAGAKTAVGYGRFVLTSRLTDSQKSARTRLAAKQSSPGMPRRRTHERGDKVTITRLDKTTKKGAPIFATESGHEGFFQNEEPPSVAVGETVDAWIANTGATLTFTTREIKPRQSRQHKGKGRRGR